jgi:hypothetical protein
MLAKLSYRGQGRTYAYHSDCYEKKPGDLKLPIFLRHRHSLGRYITEAGVLEGGRGGEAIYIL